MYNVLNVTEFHCFLVPYVHMCIIITDFKEGNVRLKLTVVSTEGFGDQIDKEKRCHYMYMYLLFLVYIV